MLSNGDEDTIKVIIVGDGFTGKTSLLRRFVRGDFIAQYKKTIGAEFLEKDVFLRSSSTMVKLMLWDTAGQEVFNALTQAYYRGAGAAVLVFSTVDRDSFLNVCKWKERVEAVCGPITMVLCQSKFDLSHESAISTEEAEGLAKELKIPFYRVSSKDDFNVTQLFEFTAQQCIAAADGGGSGDRADGNAARERPQPSAAAPSVPLQEEPGAVPAEPVAQTPQKVSSSSGHPAPATTTTTTTATATAAAAAAAGGAAAAAPSPQPPPPASKSRTVNLREPEAAAADKKKKKKKLCTLL